MGEWKRKWRYLILPKPLQPIVIALQQRYVTLRACKVLKYFSGPISFIDKKKRISKFSHYTQSAILVSKTCVKHTTLMNSTLASCYLTDISNATRIIIKCISQEFKKSYHQYSVYICTYNLSYIMSTKWSIWNVGQLYLFLDRNALETEDFTFIQFINFDQRFDLRGLLFHPIKWY